MGRHSSADRGRGVAAWPIVVAGLVALLAGATVAYLVVLHSGGEKASCTGRTVLPVVASPAAAPAIAAAAKAFVATGPVARSTCVSVSVTTLDGPAVVTALAGGWPAQHSSPPGMWVADSGADVAALDAAHSALTAGHTGSLARSPVVLAVKPQSARRSVSWASLAAASGGFVLTVPDPATNRASTDALQSLVAAAGTTAGTAGTAISHAAVTAAGPMLARLASAARPAPPTTELALAELAAGQAPNAAVPVLESDLAAFNRTSLAPLSPVHPSGPTAGVEVIAIPLTASWVPASMADAAAAFDAYLGNPPGLAILRDAGLRTADVGSISSSGAPGASPSQGVTVGGDVDRGTPGTTLPEAGNDTRSALIAAWGAAVSSASVSTATPPATSSVGSAHTAQPAAATTTTAATPTNAVTTAPTTTAKVATPAPNTGGSRSTAGATHTATLPILLPSGRPDAPGPAITFLVDDSASMTTSAAGAQRLTWVKSAVGTVVQTGSTSSFGLWSFNATASQLVPLGPATQPVDGLIRPAAIISALNALVPGGDSSTYGAIQTAFGDAAGHAVPGRANRVIVLTDGPDSTPGVSRDALKATVAGLAAQKGVVLDIVGLSPDVNSTALAEVAHAGGGSFTLVTSLPDLEPTLLRLTA